MKQLAASARCNSVSIAADLAVTKQPAPADVTYLEFDQLYPPGPDRDLVEKNCGSCHNKNYFPRHHLSEEGWRAAIREMRWGTTGIMRTRAALGRTQFSAKEVDTMAQYLARNFGPDSPKRELKLDPYPVDEEALSKAIFVQYDLPDDIPRPANSPRDVPAWNGAAGLGVHDSFIASDNSIWYSATFENALLRLDPKEMDPAKRWKAYVSSTLDSGPHGITEYEGHIYYSELLGSNVGDIDLESGKITEHLSPSKGAMHSVMSDAQGNIWYSEVHGGYLGKLEIKTGLVSSFPTPTADSGVWGIAKDLQGNIWTAGNTKHLIIKFDPVAEVFREYKTPTPTRDRTACASIPRA